MSASYRSFNGRNIFINDNDITTASGWSSEKIVDYVGSVGGGDISGGPFTSINKITTTSAAQQIQQTSTALVTGATSGYLDLLGNNKATFSYDNTYGLAITNNTDTAFTITNGLGVTAKNMDITNAKGDITLNTDSTHNVVINTYKLPNDDGTSGQTIITDGAGNLTWNDPFDLTFTDVTTNANYNIPLIDGTGLGYNQTTPNNNLKINPSTGDLTVTNGTKFNIPANYTFNCSGSASYDFGTGSGKYLKIVGTADIGISNVRGAFSSPSYTFTGDEDTGMWSSVANMIDFSADSTPVIQISPLSIMPTIGTTGATCGYSTQPWKNVYSVAYTTISDENTKKNIRPLRDHLNEDYLTYIEKLEPKAYEYKLDKEEKTRWGFIAQDIKKTLNNPDSESIWKKEENIEMLSLDNLHAIEVGAIKELLKRIELLEDKVKQLSV